MTLVNLVKTGNQTIVTGHSAILSKLGAIIGAQSKAQSLAVSSAQVRLVRYTNGGCFHVYGSMFGG